MSSYWPRPSSTTTSGSGMFWSSAARQSDNGDHEIKRFQSAKWEPSTPLTTARTYYGAAVVQTKSDIDGSSKDVIFVAGGLGIRKPGSNSLNVLNSIEIFDPNINEVKLCTHKLKEARYGCGAFAVASNVMCLLGGKTIAPSQRTIKYSNTVELVSDKETKILPDAFSLPHSMAFFGTASISGKVYIFGGKLDSGTLSTIYEADISAFVDVLKGKGAPKTNVWRPVGTKSEIQHRHGFVVVVTEAVCWLVGGVKGVRNQNEEGCSFLTSIGQHDTSRKIACKNHQCHLSPRIGSTGFALGNYIVVLGGEVLRGKNESLSTNTSFTSTTIAGSKSLSFSDSSVTVPESAAVTADFFRTDTAIRVSVTYLQLRMKDQSVFKIGHYIYAIGQYDFTSGNPTPTILHMNLNNLEINQETSDPINLALPIQDIELVSSRYYTGTQEPESAETCQVYDTALSSLNDEKPKQLDTIECKDLDDDSRKIQRVLSGLDVEPALVSKDYGRRCTDDYTRNKIGEGGFGSVYVGLDNSLPRPVTFAIKRIKSIENKAALKTFEKEVKVLKKVRHPNIVMLYGYHLESTSDDRFLIYEYLDGGSLADYFKDEDVRAKLPSLQRLRVMTDVLCALNFLHSKGAGSIIQHRDIKPHNICLTKDKMAKLVDCGLARIERTESPDNTYSTMNHVVGTGLYMCKVYASGETPYESACDIYSFGIVMIELITGTLNGRRSNIHSRDCYYGLINQNSGSPIENGVAKLHENCDDVITWSNNEDEMRLCELALQCLCDNLDERPSANMLFHEISEMLLRGQVGTSWRKLNLTTDCTISPACGVCNEKRKTIECKNEDEKHILCVQCITKLVIVASNIGSDTVQCPKCDCTFDCSDLYGMIPSEVYDAFRRQGELYKDIKQIVMNTNIVKSDVTRVLKGINQGNQALANLTSIICNYRCPKLVWIIPQVPIKLSVGMPSTWVKSLAKEKVQVYFICEHSFTPVSKPVILHIPPKLLRRIAPALKFTIFVLKNVAQLAKLPWPIPGKNTTADQLRKAAAFIDSLLDERVIDAINKLPSFIDNMNEAELNRIQCLTEPAYDTILDHVCKEGQAAWKEELTAVLIQKQSIKWVKNEHVPNYSL